MKDVHVPRSLDRLWDVMDDHPEARLYTGGTDLLVKMRASGADFSSQSLVCIERIKELQEIEKIDGGVRIGAGVIFSRLLSDPFICHRFSILAQAVRKLGSPPVRNMGTIGGNICTASPAGDTLPPLYVLEAELEIASRRGTRRSSISRFIKGPGSTGLEKGEILAAVRLKDRGGSSLIHHFEKVGQRNALAISIANMAALIRLNQDKTVEKIRLAWGSVAPTIVTSSEIEDLLVGKPLSEEALREAVPLLKAVISPIDDVRAGARYRRTIAANLLIHLSRYQ